MGNKEDERRKYEQWKRHLHYFAQRLNLPIHDQNCLMMLKREVTGKLQKAPTNSSAGHGLGTMACSARPE
jgi:hypothetical protein